MSDEKKAVKVSTGWIAWVCIAAMSITMMLLGYSCDCNGCECNPSGQEQRQ